LRSQPPSSSLSSSNLGFFERSSSSLTFPTLVLTWPWLQVPSICTTTKFTSLIQIALLSPPFPN
jgi:hypothetical protein